MKKYKNKYRIDSARIPNWDYGRNAAYYVTICTASRYPTLGTIVDGKMHLSEIGGIVKKEWIRTPELRPDMNLFIDEFVIMPNHFHGIIIIGENQYNAKHRGRRDATHRVSTKQTGNQFAPQSSNLASIIRGFKSSVTTYARKHNIDFGWQARYFDHIIRDNIDFNRIRRYIIDNPET